MTLPHRTSVDFWRLYRTMPTEIREAAIRAYRTWRGDPRSPGIRFKRVGKDMFSLRINDDFRAVAFMEEDIFVWKWIGRHADYDRFVERMQ